jgi:hypothetical protein
MVLCDQPRVDWPGESFGNFRRVGRHFVERKMRGFDIWPVDRRDRCGVTAARQSDDDRHRRAKYTARRIAGGEMFTSLG